MKRSHYEMNHEGQVVPVYVTIRELEMEAHELEVRLLAARKRLDEARSEEAERAKAEAKDHG